MDFSPLNIRMTVPHTNDVAELQNNMNQHGAIVHNYRTNKDRQEQEIRLKQVQKKEEVEGKRVQGDPDKEERKGGKRQKSTQQLIDDLGLDDSEEAEIMAVDQYRGVHLDISG